MKKIFLLPFFALLISGCLSVTETPPPEVKATQKCNLNLKLENFKFCCWQAVRSDSEMNDDIFYNKEDIGTYSDFNVDSTGLCGEDERTTKFINETFKNIGFNINNNRPDLILVGKFGESHFAIRNPSYYYRDIPINILGVVTLGSFISITTDCDFKMKIYSRTGQRLKEYYSSQEYHSLSIALPIMGLLYWDASSLYRYSQPARFAFLDCLNQFLADYKLGRYSKLN